MTGVRVYRHAKTRHIVPRFLFAFFDGAAAQHHVAVVQHHGLSRRDGTLGLVLISFVLPAVLTWLIAIPLRKWGWIKDGDLKLDL